MIRVTERSIKLIHMFECRHDIPDPVYGKHYKEWAGAPMFFDPFDDEEFGEEWDEGELGLGAELD